MNKENSLKVKIETKKIISEIKKLSNDKEKLESIEKELEKLRLEDKKKESILDFIIRFFEELIGKNIHTYNNFYESLEYFLQEIEENLKIELNTKSSDFEINKEETQKEIENLRSDVENIGIKQKKFIGLYEKINDIGNITKENLNIIIQFKKIQDIYIQDNFFLQKDNNFGNCLNEDTKEIEINILQALEKELENEIKLLINELNIQIKNILGSDKGLSIPIIKIKKTINISWSHEEFFEKATKDQEGLINEGLRICTPKFLKWGKDEGYRINKKLIETKIDLRFKDINKTVEATINDIKNDIEIEYEKIDKEISTYIKNFKDKKNQEKCELTNSINFIESEYKNEKNDIEERIYISEKLKSRVKQIKKIIGEN